MRPEEGAFEGLRLAAKAADRGKAAQREWPGFEQHLKELGYSPLAIAHAFSTLTAGTVEEALTELEERARSERVVPVTLAFEVVQREPELPVGHALTITGVERHGRGIRITYRIQPPLSPRPRPPRVETRDDCDRQSGGLGGSIGLAGSKDGTLTLGAFTVPLPPPPASLLWVRMSWSQDSSSLWQRPAHELRITL